MKKLPEYINILNQTSKISAGLTYCTLLLGQWLTLKLSNKNPFLWFLDYELIYSGLYCVLVKNSEIEQ